MSTEQHPTQQAAERRDEMEAINRFIHERIVKKCWHDFKKGLCSKPGCSAVRMLTTEAERHPAYTDSLDLIASIEKIVIEKVGMQNYLKAIGNVFLADYDMTQAQLLEDDDLSASVVVATAEQRARACKAAIEEHEQ